MKSTHSLIKAAWTGSNGFWLYVASLIIITVFIVIPQIPMVSIFAGNTEAALNMDFEAVGIAAHWGFAMMMLPFAAGLFGVLFCVRYVHQRKGLSVINPLNKIDWGRFFYGAGVWLALMLIFETIAYAIHPEIYTFSFEPNKFFPTLLVALILVPFQASFEELLFRGYLMQGFGTWFKRSWAAILVTGTIFGLMHLANPEIAEFGTWVISYYIITGLFFGLISVMDESIELAMGMHSINNIFGAVVVTFNGAVFQTPALFTISEYQVNLMIVFGLIMNVIFYLLCKRKYGWDSLAKLSERIVKDVPMTHKEATDKEIL